MASVLHDIPESDNKENKPTIAAIFSKKGYGEDKLVALAQLLHITGGLDGQIKDTPATEEQVGLILKTEITPEDLNSKFQENYFRKYRTGERQQMQATGELAPHKNAIADLFERLGYIGTVLPSQDAYDVTFVFGAAQAGLEGRLRNLDQLQKGQLIIGQERPVDTGQVFILAGDRELWPDRESAALEIYAQRTGVAPEVIQRDIDSVFTQEVRDRNDGREIIAKRREAIDLLQERYGNQRGAEWPTEADMARKLARDITPNLEVVVVNSKGRDGKRPDTLDTVNAWNEQFGSLRRSKASVLAISSQPFVPEQNIPLGVLPADKFSCTTVGNGCSKDIMPEALLVAFAGGFYKELERDKFLAQNQQQQLQR